MATLSPLRRLILVVGGLLSLAVITWSTLSIVDWMAGTSEEHDQVLPSEGHRLVVHNDGNISVAPSPDGRVHVHLKVHYGLFKPRMLEQSTMDGVMLESRCEHGIGFHKCDVEYSVSVPAGFTVEAQASTGDVSATGLSGPVSLRTSTGDVRADRISGTLTMRSSAGDVHATNIGSDSVVANTSAGSVSLAFTDPPRTVTAHTSAGDIDVAVPDGQYFVIATSSAGNESIDSRLQSPDSELRITATTSAGDVSVHPTTG